MPLSHLGIALRCQGSVSSAINLVQYAERTGFESVWLVEVYEADVIGLAAAISNVTRKIKIATGVVNSTLRLPTLLAMSAVTVSELSEGRFILGVGAGNPPMTYRDSQPSDKPLTRLRETLEIVRLCLSGESVNFEGDFYEINGFRLGIKPAHRIPIFGAAMGLKMVENVAQIADGVLVMMPTLEHVRAVKQIIVSTTKKHSLKNEPSIACHLITAVSESFQDAERIAKQTVASYVGITAYRNSLVRMGFSDEIREIEKSRAEKKNNEWQQVPESMASSLIIYGTPEECIKKITSFVSEGVSHPVVYPCMRESGFPKNISETIRLLAPYIQ